MIDEALSALSLNSWELYATVPRPSIAPEELLQALLL